MAHLAILAVQGSSAALLHGPGCLTAHVLGSISAGCRAAGPAAPEASGCGALLESAPPAPWDVSTLSVKRVKSSSYSRVGHLEMQD